MVLSLSVSGDESLSEERLGGRDARKDVSLDWSCGERGRWSVRSRSVVIADKASEKKRFKRSKVHQR